MDQEVEQDERPRRVEGERSLRPVCPDAGGQKVEQKHIDEQADVVRGRAVAVAVDEQRREEPHLQHHEERELVYDPGLQCGERALHMVHERGDDADAVHEDEVVEELDVGYALDGRVGPLAHGSPRVECRCLNDTPEMVVLGSRAVCGARSYRIAGTGYHVSDDVMTIRGDVRWPEGPPRISRLLGRFSA